MALQVAVALLAVILVHASLAIASPADSQRVTIVLQEVPQPSDNRPLAIARRAVIRAFAEQHPWVEIKPFTMPQISGSAMDSGPLMAIAAGIPPHAIYVNFRQSSTYIEQGFLEPMEVLLARVQSDNVAVRQTDAAGRWLADPISQELERALALIRQRVPELAWDVVYRQDESPRALTSGRADKHVWALPASTRVTAMLYRKDLFYEADLDPERPPATWDELLVYARRLTVPERNQYGLMILGGPDTLSWGVYTFLVSNGARAVKQVEDGTWRAVYGSPEAAEAVEYFWRLAREPFERDGQVIPTAVKIGTRELELLWRRGQIAMRFNTLDDELLADINPQLVGIAPVPLSPRGMRGGELNCRMFGVFSGATPQQQLAVMRYLWFITGDEAQRIRTEVYVENGFGAFVSPDLLAKFGYHRQLQRVPEAWKTAFHTALAHGVPEPYGHNTQHIYRHMSVPISQALEMDLADVPRQERIARIHAALQESERQTNAKLMGVIAPQEMRQRRIVAALVVALVAVAFMVGGVKLWRYFSQTASQTVDVGGRKRRLVGWAMLLPVMGLTLLWMYVPLSGGLVLAFTDYRLAVQSSFVGLDNFATALYDAAFWYSLGRTFFFVALMIALGFWPPILLAILLDEVPSAVLKYLFRTIFYLPAIVSGVIIMFLWKQLYDPSPNGQLNQIVLTLNQLGPWAATGLKLIALGLWFSFLALLFWLPVRMEELRGLFRTLLWVGAAAMAGMSGWLLLSGQLAFTSLIGRFELEPLRWVDSPQLAMLCVVLPTVWAGAGPGCLLYLAALKTVPEDLYEAADIDGAGVWHKVCYITLPRLKFLIGIQFIAAVIGAFKGGTDYILAMTGGGPNDATMILSLQIFIRTFMDLQFGLGAAMAWLLGLMLVGFTAYQMKMLSRAEFVANTASKDT
ncbi:MAG: extracellular solute-binding protein [Phycisphaeraceae bacterium]